MKKMTINELKTARLRLLEETIKTYNSDNRSVINGCGREVCCYSPSEKSPGCAIGRKISKKLAKKLDKFMNEGTGSVKNDEIYNLLPKKLRCLGRVFLNDIQRLHDRSVNWNQSGLTEDGKLMAENIKRCIEDDQFDDYLS